MTCVQEGDPCGELLLQPPPPPAPPSHSSNAAGWVFAAVVLAVVVYEIWAVKTHHPTISQWTKRTFGRHRWWRPFAMALIGVTLWHLFFGGPLSIDRRTVMNWKQDAWKLALALVAVAGAIASHQLALPPAFVPYAGGIEFVCTAVVIGSAIFTNKPGGSAS